MQYSRINLDPNAAEGLVPRRSEYETPEFDITAMVDLVFMMNIYFLVTFVTVALGEMNLPSADHVSPLDAETAVVFTVVRSRDGESVNVYLGKDDKGEVLGEGAELVEGIQAVIEAGTAVGKDAVLLKAERNVRLADVFRVATAASVEGVKLHMAVLERDVEP